MLVLRQLEFATCPGFPREDIGFRNRSASLLDLDDMLGDIMLVLQRHAVMDNTIVLFSSDNGYHLGEHMMPFGKGQAFETDIRLALALSAAAAYPSGVHAKHY